MNKNNTNNYKFKIGQTVILKNSDNDYTYIIDRYYNHYYQTNIYLIYNNITRQIERHLELNLIAYNGLIKATQRVTKNDI